MLKVIYMTHHEQWDTIVSSFKDYDTYWLSGYVKAFKIHGDGEPLLFYYEGNNVRGINVVMKRDVALDKSFVGRIPEGKYFDFSSPYGYGGWLIEGDDTEELFSSYEEWCSNNDIISEFVRFHPMIMNHINSCEFYDITRLGEVVHMDLSSPETIWGNLTSKNRNMIRKAKKNGVKIYNGRSPQLFESFRLIYNSTMDKDEAERYYYFQPSFYESVLNDLPYNGQVFYAEKDGIIIAAAIMLAANGWMNYHLSGSLREYNTFAPSNLLLYEASVWGHFNGYKTLYLGGGVGAAEDSLFRFKRAFNRGNLNRFYIGRKIFDPSMYKSLVNIRSDIANAGYFPEYRG